MFLAGSHAANKDVRLQGTVTYGPCFWQGAMQQTKRRMINIYRPYETGWHQPQKNGQSKPAERHREWFFQIVVLAY